MKDVAIYGAGGLGRELLLLIQQINRVTPTWLVVGFFDDNLTPGTLINGLPVLGDLTTVNRWPDALAVVVAVGNPNVKRTIIDQILNERIWFPTLVHPSVALTKDNFVTLGEGTILCAGTILTTNIMIGRHVLVNLNCTIGHDAVLNDFCALMPGVRVSGEVVLHDGVYVGTGATLLNQIIVGANTLIGAGAVVTKSMSANCTAVGVPAKPVRFHDYPTR